MLNIFYDNTRVVLVLESAYIIEYSPSELTYVPAEGGTPETIYFSTKTQMLRDTEADACGMLAWKGVDCSALDDYILSQYM